MNTQRAQRIRNIVLVLTVAVLMGSALACGGRTGGPTPSGGGAPSGGGGVTPPSGGGSATTPPAAPSNLRVVEVTADYIHLAWDDNADDEEGFEVFRQGLQEPAAKLIANITELRIGGPPCGQTFQYRVRAHNAAGASDYSNTVDVQTAPCGDGGGGGTGTPDLAVLEVACPDTRESDETIPFQLEVQNAGDAPVQGAQWRWSINRPNEGPGEWNAGGQFDLDAGASTILRGTIQPQAAGRWVIYVEVRDSQGRETNTENNRGTARITVQ